ncbi:MAG: anti-sigma factor [Ilumatobacteraceae bacterium]
MSGTDIHQLAAAYALDAVDERERAEFEAHYPTCPVCRPEVAGFRETLSQVAAAGAVAPPPSLKATVMAEISATRQLSPLLPGVVVDLATHRQRRQRMLRITSVAAALILIAIGAFVVGRRSSDTNDYADAAARVFGEPDVKIASLRGDGTGSFTVAWSPTLEQAVVMGDGLVDPGTGKAYELWMIDGAGPHAMHLLDRADGGRVRKPIAVNGSPTQWAVTVEPQAGVEAPTTDPIFVGAV